ncbi:MAG: DUF3347 domain-containing protein [Nitrospirae bacterium]|nr:DUF3347 domain-containing protein [Nitrospirota bacterium]
MKTFLTLTTLLGFFFLLEVKPLFAQDHKILMEQIMESYLKIGQSLSKGSTGEATQHAKAIVTATDQILKLQVGLPKEKRKEFNILVKRINSYAKRLVGKKDLEELRTEFDVLSHPVIGYLNTFGSDKKYFVYACEGDMNPWIQKNKEPQEDPYCDSPCGNIIKEIGGK